MALVLWACWPGSFGHYCGNIVILDSGVWDPEQPWLTVKDRNRRMDALFAAGENTVKKALDEMAASPATMARLLCTTHDPRREPALMPFRLWDYQDVLTEIVDETIGAQGKLLIEKSRDMGVSWCVLVTFLHRWLFKDRVDFLITSRKKDMVDSKKEPDTLFERLRIAIRFMPTKWRTLLLPEWNETHCAPFARLVNPGTGSTITGEPPIEDFGRQGRYTGIFFDECAALIGLDAMLAACSDAADCHIYTSTPKGAGNAFARLRNGGQVRVIGVHWMLHPRKRKGLYKSCVDGWEQLVEAK